MSDRIIKIIPENPNGFSEINANKIIALLKNKIEAATITFNESQTVGFIDCGENLESVSCPLCKEFLDFDWWGEAMSIAYESNFQNLSVSLPCCGKNSNLNELKYHSNCGFSKNEITIFEPNNDLDSDLISEIENISGEKIKLINCRY